MPQGNTIVKVQKEEGAIGAARIIITRLLCVLRNETNAQVPSHGFTFSLCLLTFLHLAKCHRFVDFTISACHDNCQLHCDICGICADCVVKECAPVFMERKKVGKKKIVFESKEVTVQACFPKDVWFLIFNELDDNLYDVVVLASTCRYLRRLGSQFIFLVANQYYDIEIPEKLRPEEADVMARIWTSLFLADCCCWSFEDSEKPDGLFDVDTHDLGTILSLENKDYAVYEFQDKIGSKIADGFLRLLEDPEFPECSILQHLKMAEWFIERCNTGKLIYLKDSWYEAFDGILSRHYTLSVARVVSTFTFEQNSFPFVRTDFWKKYCDYSTDPTAKGKWNDQDSVHLSSHGEADFFWSSHLKLFVLHNGHKFDEDLVEKYKRKFEEGEERKKNRI